MMADVSQLRSLLLDGACRTVMPVLEAHGFRPIVLKGATIAGWLYPDPTERVYTDIDVLVAPKDRDAVIATLESIGFTSLIDRRMLQTSSQEEQPLINKQGVVIDLHTALKGVRLEPDDAWRVLDARTVPWDWSGTPVRALAPPARALHLALHLAQRGLADRKAARDLQLGMMVLDRSLWEEAADLAEALDASGAFAAGLGLVPQGATLLDELAVAPRMELETRLRAGSASTSAIFLERLLAAKSWQERLRVVRGRLFPSRQWLRVHEPEATRTTIGMWRTQVMRPVRVLMRLPAAYRERAAHRGRRDHGRVLEP